MSVNQKSVSSYKLTVILYMCTINGLYMVCVLLQIVGALKQQVALICDAVIPIPTKHIWKSSVTYTLLMCYLGCNKLLLMLNQAIHSPDKSQGGLYCEAVYTVSAAGEVYVCNVIQREALYVKIQSSI